MKIKGTALKTIPEFVKLKYPDSYNDWINSLPDTSRKIMTGVILATAWYPVKEAMIIPTKKLGDLLFDSYEEAAWQLGKYSSEVLLNGVYKIFLRVSNPMFVLGRASNVLATHYNPSKIETSKKAKNHAIMEFHSFDTETYLAVHRIAGWVEKTIETTGFSKIDIKILKIENQHYVIDVSWN